MAFDGETLAQRLGHTFRSPEILLQALTHPSCGHERGTRRATAYERLEFLGDRVLGLVVADMLFHRYPEEPEGALARRHAALVRSETLARIATEIHLADHLIMSRSEANSKVTTSISADACEALIGALFVDGGLDAARRFLLKYWEPLMEEAPSPPKDAKTSLQEWAQGRGYPLPLYSTVEMQGPPHDRSFVISVAVRGLESMVGKGHSKREAEQAAATALLQKVLK